MFVPSQAPDQVQQMNFAAPTVTPQTTVKPFVPATPPVLRNVEQYQQPTLGSQQLYPGTSNLSYQTRPHVNGSLGTIPSQVDQVTVHKMSQVLAPTPASRGFMPVTSAGVQRAGVGPMQPSSPTQPAQVQPTCLTPLRCRQWIHQMCLPSKDLSL